MTICHQTATDTKPYNRVTVGLSSSGHLTGGHSTEHLGPVWNATLKDQRIKWGDIIPPYVDLDFFFPGCNWDDAGQATFNNNCQPVTTTTTTTDATTTDETTGTGTILGASEAQPTPPSTETATIDTGSGKSLGEWQLLLLVFAGVLAATLVLTPDRRRSRRGLLGRELHVVLDNYHTHKARRHRG